LEGKVVLVTGASRGIGKGIALELGASGTITYLTARSAEALSMTAAEIKELGGEAIPLVCDHGNDDEVLAVFDEIRHRHGILDILVNNASPDFSQMVGRRFWEIPFELIGQCLDIGPRSNFVTSSLAARMMIERGCGLIVNVSSHGAEDYILSAPYGAGKAAIDKLTRDMALELRAHNVALVSLWPGLVKTEQLMSQAIARPDGRLEAYGLDLSIGESPRFSGRAIVALAIDPLLMERSGGSFPASRLAREHGFTDIDGSLPPEVRDLASFLGEAHVPEFWKMVEPFPRGRSG
jgi:NAD(P)-dependent dehydrogenase (short-subunit alcohol dehydrogenase family)